MYSASEVAALIDQWQTFPHERRNRLWVLASYADFERAVLNLVRLAPDEARTVLACCLVGLNEVKTGERQWELVPPASLLAEITGYSASTEHRRFWRALRYLTALMNGADELPSSHPDQSEEDA